MTKLISIGRNLIIRLDFDAINEFEKNSLLALPSEFTDKLKGGCQVSTVLSVGPTAFAEEAKADSERDWIGRQVVTGRYPGVSLDLKPEQSDEKAGTLRSITCDEVRVLIAIEGEEGADV